MPITPPLEMPTDGPNSMGYWRSQISAAEATVTALANSRNWDNNIKSYLGQGDRNRFGRNTTLVHKDFSLVEGKKALLFFQTPDVTATALSPEFSDAQSLVGSVMNKYLSPSDTNAKAMVDEVLMDVLCPSGIGVSKIGYEAFVNPQLREIPMVDPTSPVDPMTGETQARPLIDPFTQEPIMQPNIVRESYFWNRVPPKMFLYPPLFIGSDFDQASWLGYKYKLDKVVAERVYELKQDEIPSASTDSFKDLLASDVTRSNAAQDPTQQVTLYEIWYRASDVDVTIGDPEIIRQLVILEGENGHADTPLIHRDSPYQRIENGQRVAGMKGFPIHPLTLRYVSDQAIPPSDCSVSRDQVDEMSKGRTQMIDQRDRAIPLTGYDSTRVPSTAIDKVVKGEVQELIGIPGLDANQPPIFSIKRGDWPNQNFTFNDIINRDIGEVWALGSNQLGVDTDTRRTATELSLMNEATQTRMDKERVRVLEWFAKGAEKLLALIQMFATEQQYVRIVGADGMPALMKWDKDTIAGDYSITLAPDSSKRIDGASEKKLAADIYGLLGNDPLIDPMELRKWFLQKTGLPMKLVKPPEPKAPEKPQVSVSLKGEDLNPQIPQYVNITTLLAALGIGVQAPNAQMAPPQEQPINPGGVPPVTPINKRFDEGATGMLPGGGQAADAAMVAGQ